MTDKEQIMIDGKGCRYKTWDAECSLTGDHYGDNMKPCKFIDEKSCYFKQLARKTQECEQKDKEINELHLIIDRLLEASGYDKNISSAEDFEDVYADIDYKLGLLDELKQECEELKERLERIEEDLKYQCVDCMNVKSDRYRKALEEIEQVINNILNSCLGRNTVGCRPAHNVCGDLIKILDIISKAKGEGKCQ